MLLHFQFIFNKSIRFQFIFNTFPIHFQFNATNQIRSQVCRLFRKERKVFDKCRDDETTKTRWKSTFQLFCQQLRSSRSRSLTILFFFLRPKTCKKSWQIFTHLQPSCPGCPKTFHVFWCLLHQSFVLFFPEKLRELQEELKHQENYLFFFDTSKEKKE